MTRAVHSGRSWRIENELKAEKTQALTKYSRKSGRKNFDDILLRLCKVIYKQNNNEMNESLCLSFHQEKWHKNYQELQRHDPKFYSS